MLVIQRSGGQLALRGQAFTLNLRTDGPLRAQTWENHLTGHTIRLGDGPELAVESDASQRRLWITGWRTSFTDDTAPDDDSGFRHEYFRPEFDDTAWPNIITPSLSIDKLDPAVTAEKLGSRFAWVRTHVFLPSDCRRKRVALVLGGVGIFDFAYMRVFLNGRCIGTREVTQRWHEPACFEILPDHRDYELLRFGQDNVIALQLRHPIRRTADLDELDPRHAMELPMAFAWPPHFEQYVEIGPPPRWANLRVTNVRDEAGDVRVELADVDANLNVEATYRWKDDGGTLHRNVRVTNRGSQPLRIMRLDLGRYDTDAKLIDGEQGFPVYLNDEAFVSYAHPGGFAMGQGGRLTLRQHPGRLLQPGQTLDSMELVMGVAERGGARGAFLRHIRSRMRRVRRGLDKPLAILEPFGSWPIDRDLFLEDAAREKTLLENLAKVAAAQRDDNLKWDAYSIEFWVDPAGDMQRAAPDRFPNDLRTIGKKLAELKTHLGLWISSSHGHWHISKNPVIAPCLSQRTDYNWSVPNYCRATDPFKTMFADAFLSHLRENGARLFKFDGLQVLCHNPDHDHLPGLYSVEAIQDSVIEFYRKLDEACPQAFIMLYWGYRSPWWLLHGDTLFEPGLHVEAASPAPTPTLYVRDGVTRGLDMAHYFCRDVPWLGKDSLGIWLSDWGWNSCIGKERWPEAFVMDICRGSLLAQLWCDSDYLSPSERRELKRFIDLLKSQPACFANPRFVLGNPWKGEPYGYCCTDGKRSFIALNNCTWDDVTLPLQLNGKSWDLYRWHPSPAKLESDDPGVISLRPFQVVLLEAVPPGDRPAIEFPFEPAPLPRNFSEPSVRLSLAVSPAPASEAMELLSDQHPIDKNPVEPLVKRVIRIRGEVPATRGGGILAVAVERSRDGKAYRTGAAARETALRGTLGGAPVHATPALGYTTYPSAWQAWRIAIAPSSPTQQFDLQITAAVPDTVALHPTAHFVAH